MSSQTSTDELYRTRLREQLGDRHRIVDAIMAESKARGVEHPYVLDVCPSDGQLAHVLTEHGCVVATCSTSSDVLELLKDLYWQEHRHHVHGSLEVDARTPLEVDADEIITAFPPASFDAIVFSSVLSRVYAQALEHNHLSFKPNKTDLTWRNNPRICDVILTLQEAWFLLKSGGLVVIRDGVADRRDAVVEITPKTETAKRLIAAYGVLTHTNTDDLAMTGYSMSEAQRMLYTIAHGPSYLLEACRENHWFFDENGWKWALIWCGFTQLKDTITTLPRYYDLLHDQVLLKQDGRELTCEQWPVTTIFATARKPSRA